MNYNIQMQEWLSKHQDATLEEAWRAGYMTCTDNWCGGKRELMEKCREMLGSLISLRMGFSGWNNSWNKYGAKKVVYNGITFDSTVERDRFRYLEYQQKAGEISGLRLQVQFEIMPKITKMVPKQLKTKVRYDERVIESAIHYTCDFMYKDGDKYVIEDVKSDYARKGSRDYPLRRHRMVEMIKAHNDKGRSRWLFREAVLVGKSLKIKDYEP